VIEQFVDGYAWQAWMKGHGAELPEKIAIRIDIGRVPDQETADLIAALGNALLVALDPKR
jgi:hypothetical protein